LKLKVVNVMGGGDEAWAVVELEANAVCKNGMDYPQRYAWVMRFDETGTIVQVHVEQQNDRLSNLYAECADTTRSAHT